MAADIRYVDRIGSDNWLLVRPEVAGPNFSLPYGLKVRITKSDGKRETFEILEGVNKGRLASVSLKSGVSYFTSTIRHDTGGTIKFDRASQSLTFGGSGPVQAFSGAFSHAGNTYTAVAAGTYPLQIPDYPHSATRSAYTQYAKFHNTWFRIGLSVTGSRYLHTGEISEGCVTVRAFLYDPAKPAPGGFSDLPDWAKLAPGGIGMPYPAKLPRIVSWDDVYNYLILCRATDQSVGTLTVV